MEPTPGPAIDLANTFWRPTGGPAGADGAAYLGTRPHPHEQDQAIGALQAITILDASLELEALRYVKPCSEAFHQANPGRHGITTVLELNGCTAPFPPELAAAAKASGRPILHAFRSESPFCTDWPQLLARLIWEKAAAGIFVAYLPEAEKGPTAP